MMRTLGRGLAAAVLLLLGLCALAQEVAVPKLAGHVVDLTGTLTADERARIDSKLRDFEERRGSQVVVLLVPTIGTEVIEDFATRVTDEWQLGRKGVDDGVLFAIAKQERKLRIQTGRGVQGTLTDILSKRIVADIVAPKFRTGDFAGGIDAGVDAIMKAIEGENLPLPSAKPRAKVDTVSSYGDFIWLALFGVPVVAMVLRSMFGRFLGAGATAGLTGVAAAVIFGSIAFAIVAAIAGFILALVMGGGMPRMGGGGWGGGGWGGGGWGGGGGGWSGGGMSGGGGTFDGGGASGEW